MPLESSRGLRAEVVPSFQHGFISYVGLYERFIQYLILLILPDDNGIMHLS